MTLPITAPFFLAFIFVMAIVCPLAAICDLERRCPGLLGSDDDKCDCLAEGAVKTEDAAAQQGGTSEQEPQNELGAQKLEAAVFDEAIPEPSSGFVRVVGAGTGFAAAAAAATGSRGSVRTNPLRDQSSYRLAFAPVVRLPPLAAPSSVGVSGVSTTGKDVSPALRSAVAAPAPTAASPAPGDDKVAGDKTPRAALLAAAQARAAGFAEDEARDRSRRFGKA